VDAVEALIDLDAIRKAGLKVIVDPMYGVGQLTLGTILTEARCRVTFIHERHNPLFGAAPRRRTSTPCGCWRRTWWKIATTSGWLPMATPTASPSWTSAANTLRSTTSCSSCTGICTRSRASRVASSATSPRRTCWTAGHPFRRACIEVPVGFKHIASAMVAHKALLGGESSGGLTIRGHILGKDGIFASALVVEMLARTHEKISQLRARVYDITGRLYSLETASLPRPNARGGSAAAGPNPLKEIGPYPVVKFPMPTARSSTWATITGRWCAFLAPSQSCDCSLRRIPRRRPPRSSSTSGNL